MDHLRRRGLLDAVRDRSNPITPLVDLFCDKEDDALPLTFYFAIKSFFLIYKFQRGLEYLLNAHSIGIKNQACVGAGMGETALLFLPFGQRPTHVAPRPADRVRGLEKDQQIWFGQLLPHGWDVGMFLCDGARTETVPFQAFG
jgi:hypothetical protein